MTATAAFGGQPISVSGPLEVDAWLRATIGEYSAENVDVARALCDRHRGVALDYVDHAGNEVSVTYEQLGEWSRRCATVLASLGVRPGDPVATLLPKGPELVVTILAIFRLGAVQLPLFTAFGPEAIAYRLTNAGAKLIVTDTAQLPKVASAAIPTLVVGAGTGSDFWLKVRDAEELSRNVKRRGGDLLIVSYTSGPTGQPKGALIPVKSLAAIEGYMRLALDVRPDDAYWNIADPGWAYGLYFALIGPMILGTRTFLYNAPFNADAAWRLLRDRGISNFAAAPTVYRALRVHSANASTPAPRLRAASSAGEPLNPEVIRWAQETLGCAIHDQYGQTEIGMLVNNHHHPALARPLRPGSMGHPTPGFRVVVVDDAGNELPPGVEGQVAVDIEQSPLYWFQGYLNAPDVTAQRMVGRYNVTGDMASVDRDGYFFFSGRGDDVINCAGY